MSQSPIEDLLELTIDSRSESAEAELQFKKKKPPPTFQGAFSQARLHHHHHPSQPNYHQAFNANSQLITQSSSAQHNHTNHLNNGSNLNSDSDEFAVKFLASFVTSQDDSPPSSVVQTNPLNPIEHQPLPPNDPPQTPPSNRTASTLGFSSAPPSSEPAVSPSASRQPSPSPPRRPPPPDCRPAQPPLHLPTRPPPLKLCLPPRPQKIVEYSRTPNNSPAGSTPTTPKLPPHLNPAPPKRPGPPSSRPLPPKKVKLLPQIFTNYQRPGVGPSRPTGSLAPAKTPAGSKPTIDVDQIQIWKRIQQLRSQRDAPVSKPSSAAEYELNRLEKQWNETLRQAGSLSSAMDLKQQAESHQDLIKKVKDLLGEELVRVQIEESVLRHVRGIIADRLVQLQEWDCS